MNQHCFWVDSQHPRMVRNRHGRDCNASGCRGCVPCEERACQLCGIEHTTVEGRGTDLTCAGCIGLVRDDLTQIVTMSARLLPEATHRGVRSEAADLAAACTDTTDGFEAWRNRQMSAVMGRIPGLPDDDGLHPLWVLGSWETLVREHYEQPSSDRIGITTARAYLDGHLTRLAHDPEFAFDELAKDVRRCRGHLEDVLHDGERDERGAPCPMCGRARVVKSYGKSADDDKWTCPKCREWWTEDDYRAKVGGIYLGVASALTDTDMQRRTRVAAATVRQWATRGKVARRGRSPDGRQLYDVQDVIRVRDGDAAESA